MVVVVAVRVFRAALHRFYWFMCWARVSKIYWTARIEALPILVEPVSDIEIGPSAMIGRNVTVAVAAGARVRLGRRTSLIRDIVLACNSSIDIGNDVLIAEFVSIRDANHRFDRLDISIADQGEIAKPIIIEDDVWIGRGCVVLGGVRIGRGAVIGANSVVTRDVQPYAVVVGAPARQMKSRLTNLDAERASSPCAEKLLCPGEDNAREEKVK